MQDLQVTTQASPSDLDTTLYYLVLCWFSTRGDFVPWGILGKTWGHFLLSQLGRRGIYTFALYNYGANVLQQILAGGKEKGKHWPTAKMQFCLEASWWPWTGSGEGSQANLASTFCNDPSCLLFSVVTGSSSKPTCEVGVGKHEFLVKSTAFNTGKWFL